MTAEARFAQAVQLFHATIEVLVERLAQQQPGVFTFADCRGNGRNHDFRIGRRRAGQMQQRHAPIPRRRVGLRMEVRLRRQVKAEPEVRVHIARRRKVGLLGIAGVYATHCRILCSQASAIDEYTARQRSQLGQETHRGNRGLFPIFFAVAQQESTWPARVADLGARGALHPAANSLHSRPQRSIRCHPLCGAPCLRYHQERCENTIAAGSMTGSRA